MTDEEITEAIAVTIRVHGNMIAPSAVENGGGFFTIGGKEQEGRLMAEARRTAIYVMPVVKRALDAKDREIAARRDDIGVWVAHSKRVEAERDAALAALRRIDGINDNPACFNGDIEIVLRAALDTPPSSGETT